MLYLDVFIKVIFALSILNIVLGNFQNMFNVKCMIYCFTLSETV